MTEEEKKEVLEMGKKPTPEEETPETPEEEKEGEEGEEQKTDWEAIAKAEEEKRKTLEQKMADDAYKYRQDKREKKEESETESVSDDEDKPLTRRELLETLTERDQRFEKMQQEQRAIEIARKHTTSEAEAQAALSFWKSRVNASGNLEEDILFAIGGMNRSVTVAREAELKRALRSKETSLKDTAGTHQDGMRGTMPKISSEMAQVLKETGFVEDKAKRLYKKPLARGKFLWHDSKTGKRWKE